MEPILRVENLTKTFSRSGQSDLTAVNGISFDLWPGECLGIIGESGSGKTTAVNLITRLLDVTDGKIFLAGEDITWKTGEALRAVYQKIQMVFQTPTDSFDPRCTLGDGIGESLRNSGMTRRETNLEVAHLLERCGLPAGFAGRYPHEVSGGQCQRAAIARALMTDPSVLICDEITSALDVTVQAQVVSELMRINRELGTSMVVISHNIAVLAHMSNYLYVMKEGRIVEEGATDQLIAHPSHPYTQMLMDAVPRFGGKQ